MNCVCPSASHCIHYLPLQEPDKHVVCCAGEKLIDHLKKWLEPEKLLTVTHSWEPGQECHIAAAILDLFHLLPPPAVKFLETGVRITPASFNAPNIAHAHFAARPRSIVMCLRVVGLKQH